MKRLFLLLLISCISLLSQEITPLDKILEGEMYTSDISTIQDLEIRETTI